MSGIKYDQGKSRIDLIPPEVIYGLGELYSIGAKKYTRELLIEEASELVLSKSQNVTLLFQVMPRGYVEAVTKKTYDYVMKTLQKDKDKILKNGLKLIKNVKQKSISNIESKTNLVLMNIKDTGKMLDLDYLLKMSSVFLKNKSMFVESVKDLVTENDLISITITKQDLPEDFYVATATRRSDYLMIMQTICTQHSNIFDTFQITVNDYSITLSGDRNWEKGMSWMRLFGAQMRHAWSWARGETYDPELKTHHQLNSAWNALAIYVYDIRKIGTDDRPN